MMKNYLFLFLFAFILTSCVDTNNELHDTNQALEFGESVAESKLITNEEFRALMKKETTANCVISGTIIALCNDDACDFKITMFDGRDIYVEADKNLNFSAKNQINQSIILSGTASNDSEGDKVVSFQAKGIKILGTESDKE
jgi:hypothetical protein